MYCIVCAINNFEKLLPWVGRTIECDNMVKYILWVVNGSLLLLAEFSWTKSCENLPAKINIFRYATSLHIGCNFSKLQLRVWSSGPSYSGRDKSSTYSSYRKVKNLESYFWDDLLSFWKYFQDFNTQSTYTSRLV